MIHDFFFPHFIICPSYVDWNTTRSLGLVSWKIFTSQTISDKHHISLWFYYWWSHPCKILHMSRQHSCRDMCKILKGWYYWCINNTQEFFSNTWMLHAKSLVWWTADNNWRCDSKMEHRTRDLDVSPTFLPICCAIKRDSVDILDQSLYALSQFLSSGMKSCLKIKL